MDAKSIEKEAYAAALVQVAVMFQRPDQLEKLQNHKKTADRKKAAVEAILRTGVQSQLEGIRTAISHLSATVEDIRNVEQNLQEIYDSLQKFPELKQKMIELREANIKHSQYATAIEHLKHIYKINEIIAQTHDCIVDGNLLQAHKNIMEMEHARDDLIYEVYKLKQDNVDYEINLLKSYFSEIENLAKDLAKQLWYICSRCLEAVRGLDKGPVQLVTALRIVEREERIDKFYTDRTASTNNFLPPGRPRNWRKKCFEMIANTVRQRIEGNQLEDRSMNKQWLARYLEVCRLVLTEDLKVAKSAVVPCFPPHYDIYDRFVAMYHDCISARLRVIASEKLEKNELVQLLSWIQLYGTEQILGNPRLQVNTVALLADHPILPKSTLTQLRDQFVEMTRRDLHDWMEKTLMQEKDDWYKHVHPEEESSGSYYTQLPSILFGMIEDTVSLTKVISTDVVASVLNVGIEELLLFAGRYKDSSLAFKAKHFENRSYFKEYAPTIIAVANNLDICIESTAKLTKHIRLTMESDVVLQSGDGEVRNSEQSNKMLPSPRIVAGIGVSRKELLEKVEQLKKRWTVALQAAVGALIDEVYEDINPHLSEIFTRKWFLGSSAVETICITLADYYTDYKHLRQHIRCALMMELQYKVVGEFMIAVENRRISFSNYEERSEAAVLLKNDGERIKNTFSKLLADIDLTYTDLTIVLSSMAEILCLRDKSLLALESATFVRKFADVHSELLGALIQMREDMGRADARSMAEEAIGHAKHNQKHDQVFYKLFQMCKSGSKRTFAFEETMQNVFATLI